MNNYRPISVISAMAKVFARIVYNPKISIWFSIPSLNCEGSEGNAYELLSSHLDNRTQKCAVIK